MGKIYITIILVALLFVGAVYLLETVPVSYDGLYVRTNSRGAVVIINDKVYETKSGVAMSLPNNKLMHFPLIEKPEGNVVVTVVSPLGNVSNWKLDKGSNRYFIGRLECVSSNGECVSFGLKVGDENYGFADEKEKAGKIVSEFLASKKSPEDIANLRNKLFAN